MRIVSCICFAVAFATGAASTFGAEKPETSHLAFVTEYARELAAIENIRTSAEQEQKQAKKNEVAFTAIHSLTLMQFELRAGIAMLKGMRLNQPFDELIPSITEFYEDKIRSHQRMIDIFSALIVGPKPDVDYGKLLAEMPKIRAESDYIDHALFDAIPLIFATLIDQKPDSKNHVSHLILSPRQSELSCSVSLLATSDQN